MPPTPSKLNLSFTRNAYSVFGSRNATTANEHQREQKTELLEDTRANRTGLKNGVDYINLDEEDQMEIYGYRRNRIRAVITWFLIVVTGGLLRLIFHWMPHLMLKATHTKCSLEEAEAVLLVEKFHGAHKSYYVKRIKTLTAKNVIDRSLEECNEIIINNENRDQTFPKLPIHFSGGRFKQWPSVKIFKCKKLIYVWDPERSEFLKLRGLDTDVLTSTLHQAQGLNSQEQYMRRNVYGNNEIVVPVKSIVTLLCLEVLNPFYIFQLFSFCLWLADDYYYYAVVILTLASASIMIAVFQTRRNQQKLRSTVHSSDVATVLRDRTAGETATVPAEHLVPGDILIIPYHGCLMPCDAVLLTGNCILNESMLTGESIPVTKTPLPSNDMIYETKEHARHTLFCGTKIIQARYYGNEEVRAMVIRTGFNTSKGDLVRSIMYPPPVDFKFEQDSYKFVTLLACIASIGVLYTIVSKITRGISIDEVILEALDLITIVVPPALPAAMTVGRLVAQRRLEKKKIYCTSPRAINVSGSIDCICFDKTGTLTEDGLDIWGVVSVSDGRFQLPVKDITSLPLSEVLIGMATCHGLTIIDNQLKGDPLDLKMFDSTGWTMEEPNVSDTSKFSMLIPTIVKPTDNSALPRRLPNDLNDRFSRRNSLSSDVIDGISLNNLSDDVFNDPAMDLNEQGLEVGIIRQFPFTSSLQRMSVITRTLGAQHYDLYCKGSPEMIISLSRVESIPPDFSAVLQVYTSKGYRVIALAHKPLYRLSYIKVQRLSREAVENNLTFLAFIIMENRLKAETSPVITELNTACIKIVMVTGDNMLTALSVGRDCGIVKPDTPVIAITMNQQNQMMPQIHFTKTNSPSSSTSPNDQRDLSEMSDLNSVVSLNSVESGSFGSPKLEKDTHFLQEDVQYSKNVYTFALTGETWALIKQYYPELIPKVVTRGAIFARMSPDQKQQLVQELQSLGYYVAMVGDGANDCGALKAAHTGISLSDTESSVASPFTSRETDISCVLTVIREGRAALVTSFGIFKYMAAYSLTQFISVMLLYSIDSNLTDIQFLYIDLFIISIFAFFFGRTKAYEGPLVKTAPLNSLVSMSPILSLTTQLLIVAIFQYMSLWHLRQMSWFVPFNATALEDTDDVGCLENYTVFVMSAMQYIILAVAFSKGPPYRKSLFSNYGLLTSFVSLTLVSIYIAICPSNWMINWFELVLPDDLGFRFTLIGYGILNFVISVLLENFFVDYLIFKKFRYIWHDLDKSRRKFLAMERDLACDLKWPPISLEPLSEAAQNLLNRQNATKISIEKRITESCLLAGPSFKNNSPICAGSKHFGSACEVTLNPRSLFNDCRNTMSLQTVPCFEDLSPKQSNAETSVKRRHNSESANGINHHEQPYINYNTNPIATLPRNPNAIRRQPQKLRDFEDVLVHKNDDQ